MQEQPDNAQTNRTEEYICLTLDIAPELYQCIEATATENNLSVQEYVLYILEQAVSPQTHYAKRPHRGLNRAAIDDLLRYREEIRRAHPELEFSNSVELLREAREERMRELEQRE